MCWSFFKWWCLSDECYVAFEVVFDTVVASEMAGVGVDAREAGLVAEGAVPAAAGGVGGGEDAFAPAVEDADFQFGEDIVGEVENVVDAVAVGGYRSGTVRCVGWFR